MAGSTPASLIADPHTGAAVAIKPARQARFSPGREAWRRFRRHRLAMASSFILGLIVFAVLFGPLLWRVPINEIDFTAKLEGPSWAHPFGTDDLGQDILARMLYGGRISLAVGLSAMLMAMLANDTPVVMAVTFVLACLVVFFNFIADVIYGWLDPRISYR